MKVVRIYDMGKPETKKHRCSSLQWVNSHVTPDHKLI